MSVRLSAYPLIDLVASTRKEQTDYFIDARDFKLLLHGDQTFRQHLNLSFYCILLPYLFVFTVLYATYEEIKICKEQRCYRYPKKSTGHTFLSTPKQTTN
jgi:hypothetical protein